MTVTRWGNELQQFRDARGLDPRGHQTRARGPQRSLNVSSRKYGVLVTAVNPSFVPTEGFPSTDRPSVLTLTPKRVAEVIVKVVREQHRARALHPTVDRAARSVPSPYLAPILLGG